MGWSNGGGTRSALQMQQLSQQMAHVLTGSQWRAARGLFDLTERAGGPFRVSPDDTYWIVEAFRAAAAHPEMPAGWAEFAREVADKGTDALRAGQPWRWR